MVPHFKEQNLHNSKTLSKEGVREKPVFRTKSTVWRDGCIHDSLVVANKLRTLITKISSNIMRELMLPQKATDPELLISALLRKKKDWSQEIWLEGPVGKESNDNGVEE